MDAQQYDDLPQPVKDIIGTYNDEENPYLECDRIIRELEPLGYTGDYGLCGELTEVTKIETKIEIMKTEIFKIKPYEMKGETLHTFESLGHFAPEDINKDANRKIMTVKRDGEVIQANKYSYLSEIKKGVSHKEDFLNYYADVTQCINASYGIEPQTYKNCQLMTETRGGYLFFKDFKSGEKRLIAINSHIYNPITKHILTEDAINGVKIAEIIRQEELHEYSIDHRESFIDELIQWITEATTDKILMKEDLKTLMLVEDDYILSSNSTNSYLYTGCIEFNDTCKELLELNESLGKRVYYTQDNVGKAKYTVNYHDGVKLHKDGSKFFDIAIFKNKIKKSDFITDLLRKGYKYRKF